MSLSPVRFRGPRKLHKRSSESDKWLDQMGFFRKHIARDPSCLFRAVSENIYNTQRFFHKVRQECMQFMNAKKHLFEGSITCPFENYIKEMSNPCQWGGLTEIAAMSVLYRRDFVLFEANKGPQTEFCDGFGKTIYLFYLPDIKHFDAIYTKDFINTSAFCQTLVYGILYDGVFQLKDLSYAIDKMLHDKVSTNHLEYFMAENVERSKKQKDRCKIFVEAVGDDCNNKNALAVKCRHHTDDVEHASLLKESLSIYVFNRSLIQLENVCMNCLNVNSAKDLFDNGITPFPYKVAKALDPNIYRNIEFDVWSELRRELRYGFRCLDGTTLQVGVKCLYKSNPEQIVPYHCHIQEMSPNCGPCLVFIEELGEKRIVNYEQLEPLPRDEIRPWAPPYRYTRTNSHLVTLTQMLQQIGNISRKQNPNKTRIKSKSDGNKNNSSKWMYPTQMQYDWANENNTEEVPNNYFCSLDQSQRNVSIEETTEHGYAVQDGYPEFDINKNHEPPHLIETISTEMSDSKENKPEGTTASCNGSSPTRDSSQDAASNGDAQQESQTRPVCVSTPSSTNKTTMNVAGMNHGGGAPGRGGTAAGWPPYMYSGNGNPRMTWCNRPVPMVGPHPLNATIAPPPPVPSLGIPLPQILPPPAGVNLHPTKSIQHNGSDLPMNDIATLKYYYNLGVEIMWTIYGGTPVPVHYPPRYYSPTQINQDMQQMSLHDRQPQANTAGDQSNKNNKQDKQNNQAKGNGQRTVMGPRFKRGNNQDSCGSSSNFQHNGRNNNLNRPINNRRNTYPDNRNNQQQNSPNVNYSNVAQAPNEEEVAPPEPVTYISYPPPPAIYPINYCTLEQDPSMMGMMGNMMYVNYEEPMEYPIQHPHQYYHHQPLFVPPPHPSMHMSHLPPPPPHMSQGPAHATQAPPPPPHEHM